MIRNIERLPKRIYFFAALFLIAACLLTILLPRTASDPIQSAKSVLQTIPLYPGATQVYHEDTDTPGGTLSHQSTNCSIECARVTFEAPDGPKIITSFYEQWSATNTWQRQPTYYATPGDPMLFAYGPSEFRQWEIINTQWGFPWFRPRYEMRHDYLLDIRTEEKVRGITSVELIVHRLAPMASDTPIPTLPPPPPTAPIPIVPGSVRTQEPGIPLPLPTAP